MFKKSELAETLVTIARHDGLPTRDILLARDRLARLPDAHREFKRQLESVQRDLDVIEASPFGKRQAG